MGSTDFFGYMCHGTEQGRVLRELEALAEREQMPTNVKVERTVIKETHNKEQQ